MVTFWLVVSLWVLVLLLYIFQEHERSEAEYQRVSKLIHSLSPDWKELQLKKEVARLLQENERLALELAKREYR